MKKQSSIFEMVYDHTFYPSGKYRHYLSVAELHNLLNLIIATEETVDYIRVIPFYKTTCVQHEFDEHMFFIKKLLKNESIDDFLAACSVEEKNKECKGVTRCFEEKDLEAFHNGIKDYLTYLPILVNEIYGFLTEKEQITNSDILAGNICFEVHAK